MQHAKVKVAKRLGWRVEVFTHTTTRLGAHHSYYVLIAPDGNPIPVEGDDKSYGNGWGDANEEEAWQRLPDEVQG